MKRNLLISMLFSAVAASASEHMTVAVCNVGELPAQAIEHAEAEANVAGLKGGDFLKWPRVAA